MLHAGNHQGELGLSLTWRQQALTMVEKIEFIIGRWQWLNADLVCLAPHTGF
jgi:hypothetical protein